MSEDYSAPKQIATWNRARGVWETTQGQICGHSEPFSLTWPISGFMRDGVAYELPTWEPPTGGSECSSSRLLPTVNVKNNENRQSEGYGPNLGEALRLLPTPEANTASNGGSQHPDKRKAGGHSVNLQDVIEHL